MLKVVITGGLASGKSSAAAFLVTRYRWFFRSADAVCRDLLQKGQPGWRSLSREFGSRFFDADGRLDRLALRSAIFSDAACRRTVNQLLHPLARKEILSWMAAAGEIENAPSIVLAEVPLLFEACWEYDFDVVISVYASRTQCLQRLCRRDGIIQEEAGAAISAQFSPDTKALRAHHVVDNSGSWLDTCLQLIHLGNLFSEKSLTQAG